MFNQKRHSYYEDNSAEYDDIYIKKKKGSSIDEKSASEERNIDKRRAIPQLGLKNTLSTLFVIVAICGMFSLLIARTLVISNNNIIINDLNSDIEEIKAEAKYYYVQAEIKDNINYITQVASESLDMGYPTEEQIVYLSFENNIDDTNAS